MKPGTRWRWSLSTRLLLLFLAAGALMLMVISTGFKVGMSGHWRDQVQPHLLAYLDYLQRDLGSPPDPQRAAELQGRLPLDILVDGPGFEPTASPPVRFEHRHSGFEVGHHDGHLYLRTRDGDHHITYRVQARPDRGLTPIRLAVVAGLLLVLLTLYLVIRRLLRPLHSLADGVERIGAGALGTRIAVTRNDEIGQLTRQVNHMAGQIEQMLEAKRQLLLAISHELRSPITRAKVSVELLPESTSRTAIARDLDSMSRLIEELLEGERLQHNHAPLQREPVDITRLVGELLAESYPDSDLQVSHHGEQRTIELDPARLRLLLRNLIDNALAHTPDDAPPPSIRTEQNHDTLAIEVHNAGPAIPPEHLPHLTEPFYRADPSRRRKTGGVGLGLWLCRAIAEAHGGSLTVDSSDVGGTGVTVLLPAATCPSSRS